MCLSRSASDALSQKSEDKIAEDGDPTKTQPVKDPLALLTKALNLMESLDENWYEMSMSIMNLYSAES